MKDKLDLEAIKRRCEAARLGPWKTADYSDKSQIGKNWELADFGECAHHNRKVWMTTDNQPASASNGACPCEDADFCAHARQDVPALIAALEAERQENARLREAVRVKDDVLKIGIMFALEQMRMRDNWAESDEATRKELWRNLHTEGARFWNALSELNQHHPACPTPVAASEAAPTQQKPDESKPRPPGPPNPVCCLHGVPVYAVYGGMSTLCKSCGGRPKVAEASAPASSKQDAAVKEDHGR